PVDFDQRHAEQPRLGIWEIDWGQACCCATAFGVKRVAIANRLTANSNPAGRCDPQSTKLENYGCNGNDTASSLPS
ncbi:hypothetical protein, partial [Hoeflea sp.]|uniref:hypothetical protein n=1 Tax=Hoeflea sp. TaxID=1940281 RepID=UPI002AFF54F9